MLHNGRNVSHNSGEIAAMGKRFTDTEIWNEDWFIDMTNDHKLFWIYLKDACNYAGIWRVNKKQFEFVTGIKIDLEKFYSIINVGKQRIKKIGADKWFLTQFILFQNGSTLNGNNNAHYGILKELNNYGIDTCIFEVKERSKTVQSEVKVGSRTGVFDPQGIGKGKRKKEKGGVGEKENKIPTVEMVEIYFVENGYSAEVGKKAFRYYNDAGWKDSRGQKVLNWKQKMQSVWFKDENKASLIVNNQDSQAYSPFNADELTKKNLERGY